MFNFNYCIMEFSLIYSLNESLKEFDSTIVGISPLSLETEHTRAKLSITILCNGDLNFCIQTIENKIHRFICSSYRVSPSFTTDSDEIEHISYCISLDIYALDNLPF